MAVTPEEIRELYLQLLGPEQSNQYGKAVSFEQAQAENPNLKWEDYHRNSDNWRNYAGQHDTLTRQLQQLGYSLEDLGFQNKHEYGKHDFDMYGKGGFFAEQGHLDPNFEYDWQNGRKINRVTSDKNVQWVPITDDDRKRHQDAIDRGAGTGKAYHEQFGGWGKKNDFDLDQVKAVLANRGWNTGAEAMTVGQAAKNNVKAGTSVHLNKDTGAIIKPVKPGTNTWSSTQAGNMGTPDGGIMKPEAKTQTRYERSQQNFQSPVPGLNRTKPNFTSNPYGGF